MIFPSLMILMRMNSSLVWNERERERISLNRKLICVLEPSLQSGASQSPSKTKSNNKPEATKNESPPPASMNEETVADDVTVDDEDDDDLMFDEEEFEAVKRFVNVIEKIHVVL